MVRLTEWDVFKPLTTEPPLSPPDTEEDVIEWRRYKMYKQNLLDEERLNESLLEQQYQAMHAYDEENL